MRHILVVEDDFLIRRCLAEMALFGGASSVEMVDSVPAAIAAAVQRQPSIIISDVDLGKGGRGPEAISAIRALYGEIPVIFVTGEPDDYAVRTQGSAIIQKPCTAVQLLRALELVSGEFLPWRDLRLSAGTRRAPASLATTSLQKSER